ncbi:hypothetical protein [Marinimicrobium sp. ABcell2]|uniref:hypothetical protein n=1 Tax=Marinimicrobium sp. ABcell2 TaxID=3069751 RepID=UPI0027B021D8|nr:hypothetical protein [Marinimicrobium sp. ABcell2]MDQ2078535.1 hypothetical protein [Marinimicrobium sp. ABcell2]
MLKLEFEGKIAHFCFALAQGLAMWAFFFVIAHALGENLLLTPLAALLGGWTAVDAYSIARAHGYPRVRIGNLVKCR